MSKYRTFTEQSRDQILNSLTNNSSSKQAWSFSKQKRFPNNRFNCPQVSYMKDTSTISNRRSAIGNSRRKVFTEVSDTPTSWVYNPNLPQKKANQTIGAGRSVVVANSYIPPDPLKNPGPGNYNTQVQKKRGFSMRPKTANSRNYFIQDKQRAQFPGPGNYEQSCSKMVGKNMNSKFKTAVLGGTALHNKTSRFYQSGNKTPSAWAYNTFNGAAKRSKGGRIGTECRPSFTDKIAFSSFTPGPGNYKLPTQFGHYKKIPHYV